MQKFLQSDPQQVRTPMLQSVCGRRSVARVSVLEETLWLDHVAGPLYDWDLTRATYRSQRGAIVGSARNYVRRMRPFVPMKRTSLSTVAGNEGDHST